MGAESVPRREVVTGQPRTAPAGPAAVISATATGDDTAVRRLMRRQMRAALTTTALLTALLGLLPLAFRALPRPGVPLAVWLVLGVVPYPALWCMGVWYVRRAERNEGDVTVR
ncbi:hypothetical protein [Streptomyces sp. NK08204]|uniref:hypothetical protein n=1 Tax=Streptomyces sp. NK08204 TaxID=2873260 RepID=UPI001CEDCC32|nr:hypothetical protein [Streptomyces sp. NK08204]